MNKIKIHLYLKDIINAYGTMKKQKKIYIDKTFITNINLGETKEVELELQPGKHQLIIEDSKLIANKTKKEFELNEESTEIYIGMQYLGYKSKTIKVVTLEQYNNEEYKAGEKTVKLTIHRMTSPTQTHQKDNYSVTIDGLEKIGKYDTDIEINVSTGKHKIKYETPIAIKYSSVDIPEDCENFHITFETQFEYINILNANSYEKKEKNIECIISRKKMFAGSALKTQIEIDNDIKLDVKNGETKNIKVSTGKHTLIIKGTITKTKEFEVPENCNIVCIYIEGLNNITSIDIK